VGLALFLFMALCSWRSATWIRRHTKHVLELRWASDLAAMAQVALAGYAVGGSFLNLAYFDLPYHLMTIIVLTKLMVREHLSVLAEAPSDSDAATMELAAGRPAVSFT
jgi:putative inorganic carbon (HCO3(-)) transporter